MVSKAILAALAACGCVCAASAEVTGEHLDLGLLSQIRETMCLPGDRVIFLPVSYDVPVHEMTYALIPADNPEVISAHVVTPDQRKWLIRHGCKSPASEQLALTNVSTVTPDSGGLDF